jgi:ribosomal protein L37AE/L43A
MASDLRMVMRCQIRETKARRSHLVECPACGLYWEKESALYDGVFYCDACKCEF